VEAVRAATDQFLIVKLSPNVADIAPIAQAAEAAGADALSLINTVVGMAMNLETGRPTLANQTGGLSGPAIKPIALAMMARAARAVNIPLLGLGGIQCADDALEFFLAGAAAVQVGTANFIDPSVTMKIIGGLEQHCRSRGVSAFADLFRG
jgi:dihydroorotate dehydrogenase (NAD+) catalytic subunit